MVLPPTVNLFSYKSLHSVTYRFDGLYSLGWNYLCLMSLLCRNLMQSLSVCPVTSVRRMCVVLPIKRKQTCTKANSHTHILLKFSDFCIFWSWFEICFSSETCPNVVILEVSEKIFIHSLLGEIFYSLTVKVSEVWNLISYLTTLWWEVKKNRRDMQSGNHDYVP